MTATSSGKGRVAASSAGIALFGSDTSDSSSNRIALWINGSEVTTSVSGGMAAVSSAGIALYADRSTGSNANNITFVASECNVTATGAGAQAVSSAGFAVYAPTSTTKSDNIALFMNGCNVTTTVTASAAASSAGIALFGWMNNTGNITMTLLVNGSNMTTTGMGSDVAVSSTGIALYASGSSNVEANIIVVMHVVMHGCKVMTTSKKSNAAASSAGLAVYGSHSRSTSSKVALQLHQCNLAATADGSSVAVSSSGIALYGSKSSGSYGNNITLRVYRCSATAIGIGGSSAVSSSGVALFASSSGSADNNFTLLVRASNVSSTGTGDNSVSSAGVALFGGSYCSSNRSNITLQVIASNVTARGSGRYGAGSSTGIALFANTSAGNNTSFNNNSLAITGQGTSTSLTFPFVVDGCGTTLGLCLRPSPPNVSRQGNSVSVDACEISGTLNVSERGPFPALGSIPPAMATLSLSNVTLTSAEPGSASCLSFVPNNFSTFDGVNVQCSQVGWGSGFGLGSVGVSDVYIQRLVLNGTTIDGKDFPLMQSMLPGLKIDAFTSTNQTRAAFSAVRDMCKLLRSELDPYTGLDTPTRSTPATRSASLSLRRLGRQRFTRTVSRSSTLSASWTKSTLVSASRDHAPAFDFSQTRTLSPGTSFLMARDPVIYLTSLLQRSRLEGNQSLGTSRTILIILMGDTFDGSVVNLNPSGSVSRLDSANGPSVSIRSLGSCFHLTSSSEDLLSLLRASGTIAPLNKTSFLLQLPTTIPPESPVASLGSSQTVTMDVSAICVKHKVSPQPLLLRFLPVRLPPQPQLAVQRAQTAFAVTQIIGLAGGGGAIATAGARSTVVLGLFQCVPDFDESLRFTESPFQQRFGSGREGEFVAAALLNTVLIYGFGACHALIGFVYARYQGLPIRNGFVWVRFPSLSLIPLQYLAEATCGSAIVTLIYASDRDWHHRMAAAISLILVVGLVFALPVYLLRSWAAQLIPGEHPSQFAKARYRKSICSDRLDADADRKGNPVRQRLSIGWTWLKYFIESDSKWQDKSKENPGYCRANRLLFMDYTEDNYWFIGVEVGVAALMGILGGIKLGPDRCAPVAVCITLSLVAFLLLLLVRRPYCNLLDTYFNILVTVIQVGGALYTTAGLLGPDRDRLYNREQAELMTTIGLYLLTSKLIFDLFAVVKNHAPKLMSSLCKRKPAEPPQNTDLTQRLVETIHQQHVEDDITDEAVRMGTIQHAEVLERDEMGEENGSQFWEKGASPLSNYPGRTSPTTPRTLSSLHESAPCNSNATQAHAKHFTVDTYQNSQLRTSPIGRAPSKKFLAGSDDVGMDL